jgi:hypothetical protein
MARADDAAAGDAAPEPATEAGGDTGTEPAAG